MYESQKRANKKWIENNREHFNELCKNNMKVYHERHKEVRQKKMIERYYWKKEQRVYLNILL